jgi:DNA-directed RNA polymerase subunit M/transcription elongation factor TFIIS
MLITCKRCGSTFTAGRRTRGMYSCDACFRAREARASRERRALWSDARKRAGDLVQRARQRGDLKKRPCEICGEKRTVAHHDDYARPLDVRWLCRPHHRRWHIQNGKGANA